MSQHERRQRIIQRIIVDDYRPLTDEEKAANLQANYEAMARGMGKLFADLLSEEPPTSEREIAHWEKVMGGER